MSPTLTLRSGDAVVQVDPEVGGRLVSWRVDELELLGGLSRVPEEYGCYPMAPWPGRLRGNRVAVDGASHDLLPTYGPWAMHGTVLASAWTIVDVTETGVCLSTGLGAAWPWPGEVTLSWQLESEALRSELMVSSDDASFPADMGWHPWFRRRLGRGGDLVWHAEAAAMLERGDDLLPTGRRVDPWAVSGPHDDAFEVPNGRVELHWPGVISVTCQSDARWMVVFDEPDDLICVEPQTGPPDGLNVTTWVRPGFPKRASVTWSWVRPSRSR